MSDSRFPAPAKLNLFLHVVGRRADGYHLLESVFQLLDFGDTLDIRVRADGALRRTLDLPGIALADDLVMRAAQLLKQHGVKLADLSVEAVATETLGDGSLHLLKFFEKPEDWRQNAERLDNLCERVNGVFSRRSVEAALVGITSYAEYDEAIAHWR